MNKKARVTSIAVFIVVFAVLTAGIIISGASHTNSESVREVMLDAVLHNNDKIDLFGLIKVNPGLVSAFSVTAVLIVLALIIRIFVIPRFKIVPGKIQLLLEQAVGLFDGMAKSNSPWRSRLLGGYIFTAGAYIFVGTVFELFGVQAITVSGNSVSLPAPLADINGAIGMGVFSYLFILSGGIAGKGFKGIAQTLKDFSLPFSMSFRLFGALLSGALVTELVYYYIGLSFFVPVIVGVMFTLLHALIQAYVLTMLTALFYGEVSEPSKHKKK